MEMRECKKRIIVTKKAMIRYGKYFQYLIVLVYFFNSAKLSFNSL